MKAILGFATRDCQVEINVLEVREREREINVQKKKDPEYSDTEQNGRKVRFLTHLCI